MQFKRLVLSGIVGAALSLSACTAAFAQDVIRLWPGKAPGTESWTIPEQVRDVPKRGRMISNVSAPTLEVFLPKKPNGTAIIIAPGGGMRVLNYDGGGTQVARWLTARGYAAFVLKYRIRQQAADAPRPAFAPPAAGAGPSLPGMDRPEMVIVNANANPAQDDPEMDRVRQMAVNDAQQALKLVRGNAVRWRINPAKVGIMGFSAGGGVAVGSALEPAGAAYPDFVVTLFGPSLQDVTVPPHAAPLFMAVTQNHYNVTPGLVALFTKWREARKPAELHIYDMANAPIGMERGGTPSDTWLDRVIDWMALKGFAPKVTYRNQR
ncbi:MAG: alpha/beta hydrolase [Novosphingobium sp.]